MRVVEAVLALPPAVGREEQEAEQVAPARVGRPRLEHRVVREVVEERVHPDEEHGRDEAEADGEPGAGPDERGERPRRRGRAARRSRSGRGCGGGRSRGTARGPASSSCGRESPQPGFRWLATSGRPFAARRRSDHSLTRTSRVAETERVADAPKPITGRCLCGGVTYSADAEPAAQAACHCADCQRQTGNPFSVIVGVPRAAFNVEGDTLASFSTTGADHGEEKLQRSFCSACGSPIVSFGRRTAAGLHQGRLAGRRLVARAGGGGVDELGPALVAALRARRAARARARVAAR